MKQNFTIVVNSNSSGHVLLENLAPFSKYQILILAVTSSNKRGDNASIIVDTKQSGKF